MNKPQLNLQDIFLNQVRKENISVTIYLIGGVQLRGMVRGFDAFTILLDSVGKPTQFVVLTLEGGVTATQWLITLPFAVLATATTLVGIHIRDRIDAATYRRWLLRVLFVIALVLLVQYAFGRWG